MVKKNIANFVTLLNSAAGFAAIIFLFLDNFILFLLFILIALILDGLDGLIAKKLKIKSKIGAQLDSLADAISFVLVPALLVYTKLFNKDLLGILAGIIVLIFGLYRLAKFNVSDTKKYFIGMPTPLFTVIIILLSFLKISFNKYILLVIVLLLSYLTISKIRFPKLSNKQKYLVFVILIIILFLFFCFKK